MKRGYLPSAQFTLLVGSLAAALGLVWAAQLITHRPPAQITVGSANTSSTYNWQAAFDQIEAEQASSSFAAPNPSSVSDMLSAAQSPNLTDSVARSLLVNLGSDESQGLGSDIPTQDALVAEAASQIANTAATTSVYGIADLDVVNASQTTLHDYGNAVMETLAEYPDASEQATFLSIDKAVEGGDTTQGETLLKIGAAYKGAAQALLALPVPQTLAPLHLSLINELMRTGATFSDMAAISTDSLRGLEGLQNYETDMDAGARVFTQLAQALQNDDILFTKDEPGSAWAGFLSAS